MSGLSESCTCGHVDGYRIPRRSCPTHGPSMPPARPAHEDPLRLTFTRDELDDAVAAAREEAAAALAALERVQKLADLYDEPGRTWTANTTWAGIAAEIRYVADIRKRDDRAAPTDREGGLR